MNRSNLYKSGIDNHKFSPERLLERIFRSIQTEMREEPELPLLKIIYMIDEYNQEEK